MWQEISLHIGAIDMECLLTIAPREQVLSAAALGFICLFLFLRSSCADGGAIFYPARRSSKSSRFAIDCVFFLGKGSVKKHPRFAGLNVEFSDGKTSHLSSENQTKMMDKKSSTMEVLLERSQSHFVAQLWLPPLLELHSKEVKRAATKLHVGRGGRNPSVRSHKTTKSFESWLCENLRFASNSFGKSQISSLIEHVWINNKFLKNLNDWSERIYGVFQLAGLDANSGTIWWGGIFQSCSALAQQILLKIWNQKMVKCVVIAFFFMIFMGFFEVVAVLLVICYTKLMLIFEKSW